MLAPLPQNSVRLSRFGRFCARVAGDFSRHGVRFYIAGSSIAEGVSSDRYLHGNQEELPGLLCRARPDGVMSFLCRGFQIPVQVRDLTPDFRLSKEGIQNAGFSRIRSVWVRNLVECRVWLERLHSPVLIRAGSDLPASVARTPEEAEILASDLLELCEEDGLQIEEFAEGARVVWACLSAQEGRVFSLGLCEELECRELNSRKGPMFCPPLNLREEQKEAARCLAFQVAAELSLSGWFEIEILVDPIGGRMRVSQIAADLGEAGLLYLQSEGVAPLLSLLWPDVSLKGLRRHYLASVPPDTRGIPVGMRPDADELVEAISPRELAQKTVVLCRARPDKSSSEDFSGRLSTIFLHQRQGMEPMVSAWKNRWPLNWVELIRLGTPAVKDQQAYARMQEVVEIFSRAHHFNLPLENWFYIGELHELKAGFYHDPLIFMNARGDIGYLPDRESIEELAVQDLPLVAVHASRGKEFWLERLPGDPPRVSVLDIEGPVHPSLGDGVLCTRPDLVPGLSATTLMAMDACIRNPSRGWHSRLVVRDGLTRIRWILPGPSRYSMLAGYAHESRFPINVKIPRLGLPGIRPDPHAMPIVGGMNRQEALRAAFGIAGLPGRPRKIMLLAFPSEFLQFQELEGLKKAALKAGLTLHIPEPFEELAQKVELPYQSFAASLNDLRLMSHLRTADAVICPLSWHSSRALRSLRRLLTGVAERSIPILPDAPMAILWLQVQENRIHQFSE